MSSEIPLLIHSPYTPHIGGHAPGDVRESFVESVQAYLDWDDGDPEPMVELREHAAVPISRICGILWNCTDTMPGNLCAELKGLDGPIDHGGTYAQGARFLRSMVSAARP